MPSDHPPAAFSRASNHAQTSASEALNYLEPATAGPHRSRLTPALLSLASFLAAGAAIAAPPTLVKDINQAGDPSEGLLGSGIFLINNQLIFSGDDGLAGTEPWISDGTAVGTQLLAEVKFDGNGGNLGGYVEMGGDLYFYASDGSFDCELWRSDLSINDAHRITDFSGSGTSSCPTPVAAGSYVYFNHAGPNSGLDTGMEMWRTDGTVGAEQVFEILLGPTGATFGQKIAVGSSLYFVANDGVTGDELWRISQAGVLDRIDAIDDGGAPVETFTSVSNLFDVNGTTLVFSATDGTSGVELYKFDGTTTTRIADIAPAALSSSPRDFVRNGPLAFFTATDGTNGRELWSTDGTTANMVKNIHGSGSSLPEQLVVFDGDLYFFADDGTGMDLWTSDGTLAGTTKVYELPFVSGDDMVEIDADASQMWFWIERDTGAEPLELWRSDGTDPGTTLLHSFEVYWRRAAVVKDGELFFAGTEPLSGRELWRSDGTAVGTEAVLDHSEPGSEGSDLVPVDGDLYLTAKDGINGRELWFSDGTTVGTYLRLDGDPAGDGVPGFQGAAFQGFLYFSYETVAEGLELFRINQSIFEVAFDLFAGPDSSYPDEIYASGSHLFWYADHPVGSTEMMITDGTVAIQGDTNPSGDDDPENFFHFDGWTYFSAITSTSGDELCRSDGTAGGTGMFKDLHLAGSSSPDDFGSGLGLLFFSASDADGREPWISDGTVAGTQKLLDVRPGPDSSSPEDFVEANGVVFFRARNASGITSLYVTDGTGAGTQMLLEDIISDLVAVPGGIVFEDADPTLGSELFFSDGITTTLVKDILPGASGSNPYYLVPFEGAAYFLADDGVHGQELWTSNGTAEGTHLVVDVRPGLGSSRITDLTPASGGIYFLANDGVTGEELHRFTVSIFADGFESGSTTGWTSAVP